MTVSDDKEAKQALRAWPGVTEKLWEPSVPGAKWLRAQPVFGAGPAPRMYSAGSRTFSTQPDGLYICLAPIQGFADVIAIEACGSRHNFNDKRSRYSAATVSRALRCDLKWLTGSMPRGRGCQPRWKLAGTYEKQPVEEARLPIRFLRVLYFLKDDLFNQWRSEGIPEGHEFVSRYKSIRAYNSQGMQVFLRRMMPENHFYP